MFNIYPGSSTHPKVALGRSCIRSNWNLEMLITDERRKPQKKLSEESKEPTTNLTHSWPEPGPRWLEASAITTTPSLLSHMLISRRLTTWVACTMELACNSQLVMEIRLTGVQIINHTSDLLIKSMATDTIGRYEVLSNLIVNDTFGGP